MTLLAYYTMAEAEGATQANDSSGSQANPLTPRGTGAAVTFGSAIGPATDDLTAAQFAGGGQYLASTQTPVTNPSAVWVSAFFSSPQGIGGELVTVSAVGAGWTQPSELILDVSTAGRLRGVLDTALVASANGTADDGALHHALVTVEASGGNSTVTIYLDGAEADTTTIAGTISTFGAGITVGSVPGEPFGAFAGTMAHVVVGEGTLTAADVADMAEAGLTGHAGETAADRLARYARWAGIPAAEYDFDSGATTPIAHIDSTGQSPVELMQKVAETDGGVLFDAPNGVLTYRGRASRYNASAALTLNFAAGQVQVGYAPRYDRSALINKVTATAADGTYLVTAENTASIDEYGVHSSDLELATTDTDEAHAAAWWRVNTYGEPSARAAQLTVDLAKRGADGHATILAVRVGDKITVNNLPSQSDESSKSFFVEGYTETITDSQHFIEFNVSPADGFEVWEIGHGTYGQFDAFPIAY